ncbi:MAG: double zinc ribbon domain-containing protein [Planctomycetota bacterium]
MPLMPTRLKLPSPVWRLPSWGSRLLASPGAAADLLFPPSCFACGQRLEDGSAEKLRACAACLQELSLTTGPACPRCAAPAVVIGQDRLAPCASCKEAVIRFDHALAAGVYEGLLRQLVLRAKRASEEAVAMALGRLIVSVNGDQLRGAEHDVVTSIPMHWRRRFVRQTNAPELMAEVIAGHLAAPFAPRLMKRLRATQPQAQLARSNRLPNVRRAFAVRRGYKLEGATVVLVDDILTTGATCSEATRALKDAGAGRVIVVVAARSL